MADTGHPTSAGHFDFPAIVEDTIRGILGVIGGSLRTAWDFLLFPERLPLPSSAPGPSKHLRPLTFLTLAVVGMMSVWAKLTPDRAVDNTPSNPVVRELAEGWSDLNTTRLLMAILPILLMTGLYSWAIASVSRLAPRRVSFDESLTIAAYFTGTISLIYMIALPPMVAVGLFPWHTAPWQLWVKPKLVRLLSGLVGLFFLRCAHSYMHLLRSRMQTRHLSTIGLWILGVLLFWGVLALVMMVMTPVLISAGLARKP